MDYKIDNKKEIEESLIESFKLQYGSKRSDIAKGAKEMKAKLKGKDPVTKEYVLVLDRIIKEYTRKKSIQELEDDYNNQKWANYQKSKRR